MLVDNFIKVSDQTAEEERARRVRDAKSGRVVRCARDAPARRSVKGAHGDMGGRRRGVILRLRCGRRGQPNQGTLGCQRSQRPARQAGAGPHAPAGARLAVLAALPRRPDTPRRPPLLRVGVGRCGAACAGTRWTRCAA